jgi:hypothetical protein
MDVARGVYPTDLLREGETGLCLFAAAFLGENDAVHMRDMGMTVDCVDTNGERLLEMRTMYPEHWLFHERDAWDFARKTDSRWDVVSVDPFTGGTGDRALADLALWCSLARRLVTITLTNRVSHVAFPRTPDGWKWETIMPRSANASWLVLTRD